MSESAIFRFIWTAMATQAPKTRISTADYDYLMKAVDKGGVVAEDGTIYGKGTYEQLDTNWALAVVNYAINKLDPSSIQPFGTNPYSGKLESFREEGPLIAIIGDWGTGNYTNGPAAQILKEVQALNPDYIIHLGDVYYAGTDWRPMPGEEQANLLNMLGYVKAGRAFTLNSNHEMYGAASGYFDIALGKDSIFAHQNQTSYFKLEFGDWVILGLDSAYYSDAANGDKLYMDGAIGDAAHTQQKSWIRGLQIPSDKKLIIMTHHNPISYNGGPGSTNTLLQQVVEALRRWPDYWYWGHVHIGAVYNQNTPCKTTKGRCMGHSAIPFGVPWGFEETSTTDYYSKTLNKNIPGGIRCLNGYMTIQLGSKGTIQEKVYEQGNSAPVWMN